MKPLLAHVYEPHRVTYPCYVQPKLNGIRALYQNGSFQSRDELPFTTGLLDHLAKPLLEVFDPSVILDGELYVHGWPLQRINAAVTPVRQKPTEDTKLVEYHVFDAVNFHTNFLPRLSDQCEPGKLHQVSAQVKCVETRYAYDEKEADKLYAHFVSLGYEGMMYRLGDCPYTVPKQEQSVQVMPSVTRTRFLSDKNNRVWHLLKRKDWQDDEFECVDVVEGEGKLKGMLGALTCRIPGIEVNGMVQYWSIFSVGSGLTDSERAHFWANPPIGKRVKVKYLCLSQDGIPLNPTILCIDPK